ncbi:MAG: TonB-dependent receptor [Saprospiraceae bacterium]|nr:TonB-dependent receptor [Saprospiraceae bacterium]
MLPMPPYCYPFRLMLWGFLLIPGLGWGQVSILDQQLDIEFRDLTPAQALRQLKSEADLRLVYSPDLLEKADTLLNTSFPSTSIRKILQFIFAPVVVQFRSKKNQILIAEVSIKTPTQIRLSGFINDAETGEILIGATLWCEGQENKGTSSNQFGYFTLHLPPTPCECIVSYLGYQSKILSIDLSRDTQMNLQLAASPNMLSEVVVLGTEGTQPYFPKKEAGHHQVDMQLLRNLPALGGEVDLVKAMQLLPGIKAGSDGAAALFVRGGELDQNLILLDDAPVYSPSHLLGFFSIFNPELIRSTDLYTGAIPVEYGGRLSSVIRIQSKEGNQENTQMAGGIGILASKVLLEGPLKKGEASYILAARRTYPDLIFRLMEDQGGNRINFLDLNAKVNWKATGKHHFFLSSYLGQDNFSYFNQFQNSWGNRTLTLRWNYLSQPNFFGHFSLVHSQYKYEVDGILNKQTNFTWASQVKHWQAKADFQWYINSKHRLKFGGQSIWYDMKAGSSSESEGLSLPTPKAVENSWYMGDQWALAERWTASYGVRLYHFQNRGPFTIHQLDDTGLFQDSTVYNSSSIFNSQWTLLPRLQIDFQVRPNARLQWYYTKTQQFVQELRNSNTPFAAFYTWMPSHPQLPASKADQYGFGYQQQFSNAQWEISVNGYYRQLRGITGFRDHADLVQNKYLNSEFLSGKGKAYGLECMLQRKVGTWKSWLAYTWSRTWREFPDVENGRRFPAYHDQPHTVKWVMQKQFDARWQLDWTWQYASGLPATPIIGSFEFEDTFIPIYGARNSTRLGDFHRLDLSISLSSRVEEGKRFKDRWTLSIYNMYAQKNALSVNLLPYRDRQTGNVSDTRDVRGTKVYVFSIIPSIAYHFSIE